MAERKWIGSMLLPRRQREDFNDDYDSIASKVAREWLLDEKYEVYSFQEILHKFTDLRLRTRALKRDRRYVTSDKGQEFLQEEKEFFNGLFDERLEDLMEYEKAVSKLSRDKRIGLMRNYAYFGIGPDFIVKKDHEVSFVDVIVNQAKPKKYSRTSFRIAKAHGFKTMALKLDVRIKVNEVSFTDM